MKNLFKNLMLVAVAAMGFTACEQVIDDVNAGIDENTVTMTFVAGAPESRTSVSIDDDGDVAKYSWSAGDKVGFYYVDDDNATGKKKGSNAAAIADDGTATFNASFEKIEGASAYNIGAFYPSDSWDDHAESDPFNNVNVKIPAGQALTDGSFDRNADLMMSKPFMGVALSPDDVKTLEFTRIAAIGKMNLKLEDMEEGEIINKVRFSFADGTHFNGPVSLDLENGDYTLATVDTSNCVELSGELAANADRTAIYFTCFPGEYSGDYTIEVITDKANYSKTGTLSNALLFSAGDVLNFNATVGNRDVREVKVVYTLVTDASTLAVGDKVIIVAKDHTAAMSTAQNENNRGEVAVSKKDNTISYVDEPQILTLEAGKTSGTFAFNTGSGYLYAASSSKNWLRTETTLSANSSWSITIAAVDGTATIKAQGSYTRNVMQYNQASALFACYSSASQKALSIYKGVEDGGDEPEQPGGGDEPDQPGGGDEPDQPGGGDEPDQPGGGDGPTYTPYTENFTTWTENGNTSDVNGTVNGNACSWTYVGASKQYWSNVSSGSNLSFAITLLKPGSADATYVLSETLSGGIKNLKLTARSNNQNTGVNVYVIDLTTNTTHKVGTLNTTSKKTDFTGEYDLTDLNITGNYQIKIANKSTAAYCCIGGLSWNK